MPRQLRQRSSRPNYTALLHFEDEDGVPHPHSTSRLDDDAESGSDFAADGGGHAEGEEDDEDDELEDEAGADNEDEKISPSDPSEIEDLIVATQASTSKAPRKAIRKHVSLAPSISTRQVSQAFVIPSTHHRHRAVPLYNRPKGAKVERLADRPRPFVNPGVVPTNSFSEEVVRVRVPKAWSYNVGPGPLWEVMEDRGWYSESAGASDEHESIRRPLVHQSIKMKDTLERLTAEFVHSSCLSWMCLKLKLGPLPCTCQRVK
jgi:transcription factor C subunit 6